MESWAAGAQTLLSQVGKILDRDSPVLKIALPKIRDFEKVSEVHSRYAQLESNPGYTNPWFAAYKPILNPKLA